MHPELIEFGQRVMFQPLDHKNLGSAQPRWSEGVFVGIRMHTGEKLVATENGVCKTRSIRRRVEAERWDPEKITKVTGTPWKPYIHSEDDKLLTRAPQPALDKAEDGRDQVKEVDDNVVPRSFAILRKDLVNHGYTPGCQGCYAAAIDRKHKPHTPACRNRIAQALMGDDKESHRIRDAKDREDAFLENAVRQGDVRQDKDEEVERPMSPITPTAITPTASVTPATPTEQENEASNAPISYEDILMENDFHDVVNQDQQCTTTSIQRRTTQRT